MYVHVSGSVPIALVQVNCSIDQFQVDSLCKVRVSTKITLKRKQMSIDLKTKHHILVEVEKGKLLKTKIAEKFGIPKSTLSTIIKNIDKKQLRLVQQTVQSDYEKLCSKALNRNS